MAPVALNVFLGALMTHARSLASLASLCQWSALFPEAREGDVGTETEGVEGSGWNGWKG